jgi:hypothetical protein
MHVLRRSVETAAENRPWNWNIKRQLRPTQQTSVHGAVNVRFSENCFSAVMLTRRATTSGRTKPGAPHPINGCRDRSPYCVSRSEGVGDLHRRSDFERLVCAACIDLAGYSLNWHKPSSTSAFMWIKL